MKPIKIRMFDDEADQLDANEKALFEMFTSRGIEVDIGGQLFNDVSAGLEKALERCRPEIVIFDNHIGKNPSQQMFGQNMISELKDSFPDSVFVLLTRNYIRGDSLDKKYPQADLILRKHGIEVAYDDYAEWVVETLGSAIGRARITEVDWSAVRKHFAKLKSRPERGSRRPIKESEIRSLVEQVCFTGGMPDENIIEAVKLEPLIGGKSDAVVCVVSVQNRYGDYQVPAVLKIMPIESAKREAHNHAKFVKWVLPYRWRVDVVGKGSTGDFGAVCYSFAHGGAGQPETLSDLIKADERARILSVMADVFDPDSQAWYSKIRETDAPLVVSLARTPPYFSSSSDDTKREEQLLEQVELIKDQEGVNLIEKGKDNILQIGEHYFSLGSTLDEIFGIRDVPVTKECLSHGDLNSGNILVRNDSTEFCFIDFQHTGYHHIARDFCSLEGSFRTLQFEEKAISFAERVEEERKAWARCEERSFSGDARFQLIDELRRHFFANHKSSALELAIANLIHTWWLLSFASEWNEFTRRRLIAFFFATLSCIQDGVVTAKSDKDE